MAQKSLLLASTNWGDWEPALTHNSVLASDVSQGRIAIDDLPEIHLLETLDEVLRRWKATALNVTFFKLLFSPANDSCKSIEIQDASINPHRRLYLTCFWISTSYDSSYHPLSKGKDASLRIPFHHLKMRGMLNLRIPATGSWLAWWLSLAGGEADHPFAIEFTSWVHDWTPSAFSKFHS